jgi:hypothetical protein
MALDDFVTEKKHEIGSIKSRKKAKNVTLSKAQWKDLFAHNPKQVRLFCHEWEENEIKAVVSTMDEMLDDEEPQVEVNQDQLDQIEEVRDDIISEYLDE